MKLKRLGIFFASLLALGLFLTACSHSIKEKKAEFAKTIDALQHRGFVLLKKKEGDQQSSYLFRLDRSDQVSAFLLESATGSVDPYLSGELSDVLRGMRLDLEVNWARYAEAKPGSVTALLLPKENNASGELNRLLREKKIAADLDFDKSGHLKRVTMRPLDEKIRKGKRVGRLQLKDTFLVIHRKGGKIGGRNYTFENGLSQLHLNDQKGGYFTIGTRGLQCDIAMEDAYYGRRECQLNNLTLEMDTPKAGQHDLIRFVLDGIVGKSRIGRKNGVVDSDGQITLKQMKLTEDSPREKVDGVLAGLKIEGQGSAIAEKTYRRLVDLLRRPPVDQKEMIEKLTGMLGTFFQRLVLGYRVDVERIAGKIEKPALGEKTEFDLDKLALGIDWNLSDDFNISKRFSLAAFDLHRSRRGKVMIDGNVRDFALGIRVEKLYNFLPELMHLSRQSVLHPRAKLDPKTRQAAEALGEKVVRKGVTLIIDPLKVGGLTLRTPQKNTSLDALSLTLKAELVPNQLDPRNPMAPMLALAYLKAGGNAALKKKDLEQILPLLSPAMKMMVVHFVKYEGEKAVFTLRFEQGNLLINGKPLR